MSAPANLTSAANIKDVLERLQAAELVDEGDRLARDAGALIERLVDERKLMGDLLTSMHGHLHAQWKADIELVFKSCGIAIPMPQKAPAVKS